MGTIGMKVAAALLAGAILGGTVGAQPAAPSAAEAVNDPSLKALQLIAFIGLKPGDQIADIFAGKLTRAFSLAVGPRGAVHAIEPGEYVAVHAPALAEMQALAAQTPTGNIHVGTSPIDRLALPKGLNAVYMRQNYHDLHDKFMGPADVAAVNRAIFAALKPGGVFVVQDHAAVAGSGLAATETLHRIDPETVKQEAQAAGFLVDGESKLFANPDDPKTKLVFDPSIRGKTDQFLLRFRKPR